jgi:hypothetical protein
MDPTCFERWRWYDTTSLVGNAGIRQHRAIFKYQIPEPALAGLYYELDTMISVRVAKKNPTYTAPPTQIAIYGSRLTHVDISGYEGWQWLVPDSLPEVGTNPYPAIYSPSDTFNYNTIDSSIMLTILKGTINATIPSFNAVYGDTLNSLTFVDAHWQWATPDSVLTQTGLVQYRARYVPDDQAHYYTIDTLLTIMVSKRMPDYTLPQNLIAYYGDTLTQMPMPLGWRWTRPAVRRDTIPVYNATYDEWRDSIFDVIVSPTVGTSGMHTYSAAFLFPINDTLVDTVHYFRIDTTLDLLVMKSIPPYSLPTGLTAIYGQKLREVYWGANNWTWKANINNTPVGNVGMQRHEATFRHPDTNYLQVDTVLLINVTKAKPADVSLPPLGLQGVYGDELNVIALVGRWTWLNPASLVGEVTLPYRFNYHPAVYTPLDNNNYDTIIRMLPVTVISQQEHVRSLVDVINAHHAPDELRRFIVDTCNIDEVFIKFNPYGSVRSIRCMNKLIINQSDTLHLDVLRPDVYFVPFEVEYASGVIKNDTIFIERRFEVKDIVIQKFGGKLLVINNNFERNNGYNFTSFVWYKYDELRETYFNEVSTSAQCCEEVDDNSEDEETTFYIKLTYTDADTRKEKRISTCIGSISSTRKPGADLLVYPIPANGTITVENIHWQTDNTIKIYNLNGSLIQNYQVSNSKETLDITPITLPGTYFLSNDNRKITIVIR